MWLSGVGILSLLVRVLNLGSRSMWLDEILETLQAQGSYPEVFERIVRDAVHPPLEPTLTWLLVQLGLGETTRRLVPIAFGVATVVVLARFAARRFSERVGILVGVGGALAPIHIHYSQELRPYSLALLLAVLSLWYLDRYLERGSRVALVVLWLALLGLLYTLYIGAVLFAPLATMVVAAAWSQRQGERERARKALLWSPAFFATLALAYLPWLVTAWGNRRPFESSATGWTWRRAGARLQHLLIGGREGDPFDATLFVALLFLGAGAFWALRHRRGWGIFVGALVGTVGIEIGLQLTDHWTNDRYSLMAWPFLAILLALGVEGFASLVPKESGKRWATVLLLGVLAILQLRGIALYYDAGRPDWRPIARAVGAVTTADSILLASNEWTRICLTYYLDELGESPGRPRPEAIDGAVHRAMAATDGDSCAFLVAGGYPEHGNLKRWLADKPLLATEVGGLGARFYRLTPYEQDRGCVWSLPLSGDWGEGRPETIRFDATTRSRLLAGWSEPEQTDEGRTFVWATGEEAVLALGGLPDGAYSVRLTVWPYEIPGDEQQLTVSHWKGEIGRFTLEPGRQQVHFRLAAGEFRPDENLLRFRFGYSVSPQSQGAGEDPRGLAVAFEELQIAVE